VTQHPESPRCAICGQPGTVMVDPPRRTIARGADPSDSSFSVIAVLPDVLLCEEHAEDLPRRLTIGWCDDERCRLYGESGEASPCGEPFRKLKR
jgi:hypothetical protein